MLMLEELKEKYGLNNPFLLEEISQLDYSYDTVKAMLSLYVKQGDVRRYSQGVYYFPKQTELGEAIPSFEKIINKKYLCYGNKHSGYISGWTLLNKVGLTTQVPNTVEIVTNNEKTRKRSITIANRKIIVRKPTVEITNQNVGYLQFLDLFKYATIEMIQRNRETIIQFYRDLKLKFDELMKWKEKYSNVVKSKMRESGIEYELALIQNKNSN